MKPLSKKDIYELTLKCQSITEFRKEYFRPYRRAIERGWWKDVSSHLSRKINEKRTINDVMKVALQYDKLCDFIKHQSKYYIYASRKGWLPEVTKHMIKNKRWNLADFELVYNEAKKYKFRNDFQLNAPDYHYAARKFGWIDKVCEHMEYHYQKKPKWIKNSV